MVILRTKRQRKYITGFLKLRHCNDLDIVWVTCSTIFFTPSLNPTDTNSLVKLCGRGCRVFRSTCAVPVTCLSYLRCTSSSLVAFSGRLGSQSAVDQAFWAVLVLLIQNQVEDQVADTATLFSLTNRTCSDTRLWSNIYVIIMYIRTW